MEEAGTSDMETVAAVVVAAVAEVVAAAGVSGSKVTVGSAGRDLGAAGLGGEDLLVAAVVLAAVAGFAAGVSALVRWLVGNQVGPEAPADSGDRDLVAAAVESAAAAAEERRMAAVLNGTVGAGCRKAALQQVHGALGIVGMGAQTGHAGPVVAKGDPAESREQQSCPGSGQSMEAAAGRGGAVGHAGCSSPGSAGRSLLDPAVHTQTSR